ncbi:MAG: tRNA (adenosine(37)-N6)-dimethylallyltransferase MiaA [Eubacteriales bacterium]
MNKLLPLVVIVGPTAVGKTEVGIKVAEKIKGEIISGDSMQVYKYMDIGTAKPSPEEMAGIPHHMIDIITPGEDFSVAKFQQMVERYITEINDSGKIPIVVGGTGLYIRSVLDRYDFSPPGGSSSKRVELERLAAERGNKYLVGLLKDVDPKSAERIHPNDTRRLIRALEVFQTVGRPISDFQYISHEGSPKYNTAYFGLNMNRQELYKKIEQRVDLMIARGLVDEVERLVKMGYGVQNTAMQALGYKEMHDYLNGLSSLEDAVELTKRNTRRFAKRQITWFRRDSRIQWIDVEKRSSLEEIAGEIASKAEGQFYYT